MNIANFGAVSRSSSTIARVSVLAFALSALAGCEVGPDFHRPAGPAPARYTEQVLPSRTERVAAPGGDVQVEQVGRDVAGDWWQLFRSPELSALVVRGFRNSPNLEAAREALRVARENALQQWGGLLPSLSGSFSGQTGQYSLATEGLPGVTDRYGFYNAQIGLSYNFDVWGGIRRGIENRLALVDLQRAQLEAIYLTLTSNIVVTAINEASLRAQIAAQEQLIGVYRNYLGTVQRQFELGGANGTDVALQRSQLAQAEAVLPPLEIELGKSRDALADYVGATPMDAGLPVFTLKRLALPRALPVSVPSALLEQRPDVVQAEANLHAATALVGVAIANRLPQFSLPGGDTLVGTAAAQPGQLFTPGSYAIQLVAQAVQPIFQGGQLLHAQRASVATMRQAAAQWQQTALDAIANVSDTLIQLDGDSHLLAVTLEQQRAAERALTLAQLQYRLGGVAYLTVLQSEENAQNAAISLVRAEASRYADTAALFVALGGGWWNRRDAPPPPAALLPSLLPAFLITGSQT